MKYFVYAYNYVTLHKAIIYTEKEWGENNTYIIYTTSIVDAPKALVDNKYNNFILDPGQYKDIDHKIILPPVIVALSSEKRMVRRFIEYITEQEPDFYQKIGIVVFRDVALRESILIDKLKKIYKSVEVIMIEEGLGVYKYTGKPFVSLKKIVKKAIYRIFGVPTIHLDELPHGSNPLTDQIICMHPDKLHNKKQLYGKIITKQIDIFSEEYCDFFIREVMRSTIARKKYGFVYLSQPIFPTNRFKDNENYDIFLRGLFKLLLNYGNVVIKPHPLDQWDYDKYECEQINRCPEELSKVAFELLFGYFGNPRALTLYSSAACNIHSKTPNIFLYDFFPEVINKDLFGKEFFADNNLIRCQSFKELKEVLDSSEL